MKKKGCPKDNFFLYGVKLILIVSFLFSPALFSPPVFASKWTQVNVTGPSARYYYALTYDVKRKKVLLFGGRTGSGSELNDLWEWGGKKWEKIDVQAPYPSDRTNSAMAYDIKRKKIVLFGGWESGWGNPYQGDTWIYNGKKWKELKIKGPAGRDKHTMVYDERKKVVVLYGGYDGNDRLNDTWTFNGKKWRKMKATKAGPPGLLNHAMVYDAKRKWVVLFGGYSDSGYNAETWIWNGTKWIIKSKKGPEGRSNPAMAFNKKGNVIVLHGGRNGSWPDYVYLDDTWMWNGKKWKQLKIKSPSPRSGHMMVYDKQRKKIVLFGGDDPVAWSALGDTWLFIK